MESHHYYPDVTQDEKNMALLVHLLAFSILLSIPFANILGPLVLWLIKKDQSVYIDYHGKEAINFQISCTIYGIVGVILAFLLIGIPLLLALSIFWLIFVIIAAVRAANGEYFRYPLTLPLLK